MPWRNTPSALGTSDEVKAAAARRSLLDELPVTAEDAIEAKDVIEALQDAKIKSALQNRVRGEVDLGRSTW